MDAADQIRDSTMSERSLTFLLKKKSYKRNRAPELKSHKVPLPTHTPRFTPVSNVLTQGLHVVVVKRTHEMAAAPLARNSGALFSDHEIGLRRN